MNVLVFGGSGFAGRATVKQLQDAGFSVCMANRGTLHWNDRNPFKVDWLPCDRKNHASVAAVLTNRPWKAIVDFTCFCPEDAKPVLDFVDQLNGPAPYLIFISTDNVYNMSDLRHCPEQSEDMARFVDDLELRRHLQEEDEYGCDKLKVEELLASRSELVSWSMRLPDVYGPFDEARFWKYFLWLSVADRFPVFCQNSRELSFVFCEDVARCIVLAISAVPAERPRGATNVGDSKRLTLKEFLLLYAKCAGFKHEIKLCSDPSSNDVWREEFLPSVDYAIKVEKLADQLPLFKATPFEVALVQTAAFYRRAWDKYPAEREEVLEEFPKEFRAAIKRRAIELSDD